MGSTWIIQSTIKVRDLVKEELATSVPRSVWDSSSGGWAACSFVFRRQMISGHCIQS